MKWVSEDKRTKKKKKGFLFVLLAVAAKLDLRHFQNVWFCGPDGPRKVYNERQKTTKSNKKGKVSHLNVWCGALLFDNHIKITHIHRSCYFRSLHICPFCSSPSPPCMLSMCRCYRWHILWGRGGTPFSSYHRNNHQDSCWDICLRVKSDSAYTECIVTLMNRCKTSTMNDNRHNCKWKWQFNYSIQNRLSGLEMKWNEIRFSVRTKRNTWVHLCVFGLYGWDGRRCEGGIKSSILSTSFAIHP